MSKRINFDFYKVSMPNASIPFEHILQQVIQLPIQKRFKEVRESPLCLRQVESIWRHCWEGEMICLRMDNLPVKGSLSGNIENLIFDDDEGIGEQTAFLYHPSMHVLLLQSNQSGVSSSAFIRYFEIMGDLSESIYIDPVIQANAMEKLARMHEINKFDIQVAGLDKMEIFHQQDYGVKEIIELSKEFCSPIVTLNLSVGRKKQDGLSLNIVKNTAAELLRIGTQNKREVRKIRIRGTSDD